jgi:hypothetical protein
VAESAADFLERDIGEDTAIGEVLHVTPPAEIEWVVDRIGHAVPLQGF